MGLFPILQTPFADDGSLDFVSLARLVDYLCVSEAAGFVFPGYASEWWTLTTTELDDAARLVVDVCGRRRVAILNVTGQSTRVAIQQADTYAALGATALMCLPPFIVSAPSAEIEEHMARILATTQLPHIFQFSPELTGVSIEVGMIARLCERFPHLRAVKVDSSRAGPAIAALREHLDRHKVSYLVGYSGVGWLDAARRGATGLMGSCGHLELDVKMVRSSLTGDLDRAYQVYCRLLPLLNFEMKSLSHVIAVHKRLLCDRGIIQTDRLRSPAGRLDETEWNELALHWAHLSANL
jgi:4-hydroxy-tetrahydrodipicolinate synthase